MAINLEDGYAELREHVGHDIECVAYEIADTVTAATDVNNVALECATCGVVLIDFDHPDPDLDGALGQGRR